MINGVLFFDLPSGDSFKIECPVRLPLSKQAALYTNKPRMIVGFEKGTMYYWFGEGFMESAAAFLIQQTAGNIKEVNFIK